MVAAQTPSVNALSKNSTLPRSASAATHPPADCRLHRVRRTERSGSSSAIVPREIPEPSTMTARRCRSMHSSSDPRTRARRVAAESSVVMLLYLDHIPSARLVVFGHERTIQLHVCAQEMDAPSRELAWHDSHDCVGEAVDHRALADERRVGAEVIAPEAVAQDRATMIADDALLLLKRFCMATGDAGSRAALKLSVARE